MAAALSTVKCFRLAILGLFFLLTFAVAKGQSCDCPEADTCNPCQGGLKTLTVRYTGLLPAMMVARDGANRIIGGPSLVSSGGTLTITSHNGGRIAGPAVTITGILDIFGTPLAATTIPVSCSPQLFVGSDFSFFTIVSAASLGGTLCCSPADMAAVPPTITCPGDQTILLTKDQCDGIGTWPSPIAADDCGTPIITSTHKPGDVFGLGKTTVTYTATDSHGNSTSCSFSVTVTDNSPPVIGNCRGDIRVTLQTDECQKKVTWPAPTVNTTCVTLHSSISSGSTFSLGSTPVTYTATDAAGNISRCTFNVVVTDNTAPIIKSCPENIHASLGGSECTKQVSWSPPFADSPCVALTSTHTPGAYFGPGTTKVTYTATDDSGNKSTCSFDIVVDDTSLPDILSCPSDITVELKSNESVKVVNWTSPQASSSCVQLNSSASPGTSFKVGTTPVTYTATDASGNTSICTFSITVVDKIIPVINNPPADILVQTDGDCSTVVTWTPPTATDNCGLKNLSSSHAPGSTFPIGTTIVRYTATDVNGNKSSYEFDVVVESAPAPVITNCPSDIHAIADPSGAVSVSWLEPEVKACELDYFTSTHAPGHIFSAGTTEVTYTARDHSGATSQCSFNVIVSVDELHLDMAKVITPDGNEINDMWLIGNIENFRDNDVTIVDRWGGVVFSASGYNNESVVWRGRNNKGDMAPTGTYFYTLSVRFNKSRIEKKGFIELIR